MTFLLNGWPRTIAETVIPMNMFIELQTRSLLYGTKILNYVDTVPSWFQLK